MREVMITLNDKQVANNSGIYNTMRRERCIRELGGSGNTRDSLQTPELSPRTLGSPRDHFEGLSADLTASRSKTLISMKQIAKKRPKGASGGIPEHLETTAGSQGGRSGIGNMLR